MKDNPRKTLVRALSIGAVIIIALYSLFQAKNLIIGPILEITTPYDGQSVDYEVVEVTGVARNISEITLNDAPIYIDTKGVFLEKLIVPPGYSIMKLSVKDRFGRQKTSFIRIFHTKKDEWVEPSQSALMPEVGTSTTATSSPLTPDNNN